MKTVILTILTFISLTTRAGSDLIYANGFELPACIQGEILYQEDFTAPDSTDWNGYNQWQESGNEVALANIVNNQARLIPVSSGYSLARMVHPVETQDAEATYSIYFENANTQGVGFYLRSNGGYLQQTDPTGQGYGVFVERFAAQGAGIGLWYENDGVEISFIRFYDPSFEILDETEYRVRYQVFQESPTTTRLRARFWQAGTTEPDDWQVSYLDDFVPLQNTSGGILVDAWSTQQNGDISDAIRVDDIEVTQLCNPLLNMSNLQTLETGFEFAEGPVWRDDHYLFSDITDNTIYRWDDMSGLQIHNANSGDSNGLNLTLDGSLLAAENTLRRVSIDDGNGPITLLDTYQGDQFNSPNDLVMSELGILYFTDPDYGLNGRPREIPFNGIYSYHPNTGLVAEYMGHQNNNKPNGIRLSPDQNTLYWNDSQAGHLNKMTINPDGSLSDLTRLAENLIIPDGMCIDQSGNIYVATWNGALEVFSPEGNRWGSIPTFETSTTNCTFGDSDLNTLFITTHTAIHRIFINL